MPPYLLYKLKNLQVSISPIQLLLYDSFICYILFQENKQWAQFKEFWGSLRDCGMPQVNLDSVCNQQMPIFSHISISETLITMHAPIKIGSYSCRFELKVFMKISTNTRVWRLPRWHGGEKSACPCRRHKRSRLDPSVRKIPWRKKWQPNPVFLPGKFHGQRSKGGCSSWGCKKLDSTERLSMHKQIPGYQLGEDLYFKYIILCLAYQ